jgi:hypothetical protein
MTLTWIRDQFHVAAPKRRSVECTTQLIHRFYCESQLITINLSVQTYNKIRRIIQTLQLITITNIIELFPWTVLERVTKIFQPSSITSHIPLHHDQHQETTKRMKKEERNRGETRKPKIANKFRKFNYCLGTYIDSLKKLHSISSNYLIFDDSWDELAAEQGLRLNTIEGIVFMLINLFSLSS